MARFSPEMDCLNIEDKENVNTLNIAERAGAIRLLSAPASQLPPAHRTHFVNTNRNDSQV